MTAVINIFAQKFGSSKNLPIFVVPNNDNDYRSNRYISFRSIKAGFLSDNSTPVVLRCLATKKMEARLFCISLLQIFGQKMPNNDKNLSQTHEVCSASTLRTRKNAPVCAKSAQTQSSNSQRTALNSQRSALSELNEKIARQTARSIKPYSVQKLTEELQRATQKHTYRVSLSCVYPGRVEGNISKIGIYHTDLYEAVSETEAVGIAVSMVKQRYAFFNIDLENIKSVKLPKHIAL